MNIGELKKRIAGLSDETIVIVAKDIEGNSYSPLLDAEPMVYEAETTWSGECYPDEEEEIPEGAQICVTMWPVN